MTATTADGKMLVYCHTSRNLLEEPKIHGEGHFLYKTFQIILDEKGIKNPIIDTVDIAPLQDPYVHADNKMDKHYAEDGFGDTFINNHLKGYDIVILPDCSGQWYSYQESKDLVKLIELIQNIFKMVKDGGVLILGKVLLEGDDLVNFNNKLLGAFNNHDIITDYQYKDPVYRFLKYHIISEKKDGTIDTDARFARELQEQSDNDARFARELQEQSDNDARFARKVQIELDIEDLNNMYGIVKEAYVDDPGNDAVTDVRKRIDKLEQELNVINDQISKINPIMHATGGTLLYTRNKNKYLNLSRIRM
jgi:chaperonin cofactor prefoldin